MALINFTEFVNLVILTIAIGYILSGYIRLPGHFRLGIRKFNWQDFKYSMLIAAPAIVLHELAHKFVAIGFGLGAIFKIWYPGLAIAVFLKLIASPFLIIAPGFVEISEASGNIQGLLIAFAGPAMNLIIWLIAGFILKKKKHLTAFQASTWIMIKRITIMLFIFNMIPIPPLDGSKVLFNFLKIFSS